jgi:hypothetical protein
LGGVAVDVAVGAYELGATFVEQWAVGWGADAAIGAGEAIGESSAGLIGQTFKLGTVVEDPGLAISEVSDHAAARMIERSVSLETMQTTVESPTVVLRQTIDKYVFLSEDTGVVMTNQGRVITTWSPHDATAQAILDAARR